MGLSIVLGTLGWTVMHKLINDAEPQNYLGCHFTKLHDFKKAALE